MVCSIDMTSDSTTPTVIGTSMFERALFYRAQRVVEEGPARVGDDGYDDDRRKPVKEIAGRIVRLSPRARPQRDRKRRHVIAPKAATPRQRKSRVSS